MPLEVVGALSSFAALEPEWLLLLDRIPGVTPFQHPAWLLAWWAHFGSGRLHVLVDRDDGRMRSILPCFLHEWNGRRQITMIGTGISDYLDPLIASEESGRFIEQLQQHLKSSAEWDVCEWQDISAGTPLRHLKTCAAFEVKVAEDTPCSEILLSGSFEELWNSRSKDMRRNLRRYGDRARAMRPVDFEVLSKISDEWFSDLVRLHAARWKKQGESGMIAANRSEMFLREVAERFAASGLLRCFSIRFEGRIAALLLTFLYRNQIFSYMSAFDPEYEILGFGRMLLYEAIQYSFQQGYDVWNFLRGNEPYKFSWGAQEILKCRVTLERRSSV